MADELMTQATITSSENPAVITRIQKTVGSETIYAPFGADDENIQMYYQQTVTSSEPGEEDEIEYVKWGSLRNFFQEWLNFKKIWKHFTQEAQFVLYKVNEEENVYEPGSNIKIWFEINPNPEISDNN